MATNPSRSLAQIEEAAAAGGTAARLVETLKPYKELLTIFTTVAVSAYFVVDYFATKRDVKVLNCQMSNSIALVESRVNADRLKVGLQDASVDRMKIDGEPAASALAREQRQRRLASLDARMSEIGVSIRKETDAEEKAAHVLRFNQCNDESPPAQPKP